MTCFHTWRAWARIVFSLLFCLAGWESFPFSGQLWAAGVEFMTPSFGATVIARNPETHLVLRLAGTEGTRALSVKANGQITLPIEVAEGEEYTYLHYRFIASGIVGVQH